MVNPLVLAYAMNERSDGQTAAEARLPHFLLPTRRSFRAALCQGFSGFDRVASVPVIRHGQTCRHPASHLKHSSGG